MRRLKRSGALLAVLAVGACGGDGDSKLIEGGGGRETGSTGIDESEGPTPRDTVPDLPPDLPQDCGGFQMQPVWQPARVALVVETSQQMVSQTFDHDGDPDTEQQTPWAVVHAGLGTLIEDCDLEGPGECLLEMGALRFPNEAAKAPPAEAACWVDNEMDVTVGLATGDAILDSLPPADAGPAQMLGAAPLGPAIDTTVQYLETLDEDVPRFLMLIVGSPPNCQADAVDDHERFESVDESVVPAIQSAQNEGIPTYVVVANPDPGTTPVDTDGVPDGVDMHASFNAMAEAGGVPYASGSEDRKYLLATQMDEVLQAVDEIASDCGSCVVDFTTPPAEPPEPGQELRVFVDGVEYSEVEGPQCQSEDGWRWVEEGLVIELCGLACTEWRITKDEVLDPPEGLVVEYSCPE